MIDEELVRNNWEIVYCYQLYGPTYRGPEKWAINFGLEQITVEGNKEKCCAAAKKFTENRLEEIRAIKTELTLLDSYRIAYSEELATLVYAAPAPFPHQIVATTQALIRLVRITNRIYNELVKLTKGMKTEILPLTLNNFSDII